MALLRRLCSLSASRRYLSPCSLATTRPYTSEAYVRGCTDSPLLEECIGEHFDRQAAVYDSEVVLRSPHQQQLSLSWRELQRFADRMAEGLYAMGMRRGDRLGIMLGNRYEYVVTQIATAKAGIILVTLNNHYEARELAYVREWFSTGKGAPPSALEPNHLTHTRTSHSCSLLFTLSLSLFLHHCV
jgi:non-ribosomal peptide synthetase component E (peptide arylation enzyme)